MSDTAEYSRGYAAGRKKCDLDAKREIARLNTVIIGLNKKIEEQKDRLYIGCLDVVTKNCNGWMIGEKKINNAAGFCKLAKIFLDNSISVIDES